MTTTTTASPTATTPITRRYDFVLLFDVQDGNPNGDPDAGNMPRIDPQSLQGIVTDGCLKRKIRNAVAVLGADDQGKVRPGCELYFQTQDAAFQNRVLELLHQRAHTESGKGQTGKPTSTQDTATRARRWMCANFWDVRAFGAVMTMKTHNCGQVRGPVQMTFARSIDAIVPLEYSITRKSVTTEAEGLKQIEKRGWMTGTMGRKNTVPYGLYRAQGFVNAYLARDTGFGPDDLAMLWQALKGVMWDLDRSASRGLMATRGLYVFEHDSALGSAPAHELFDRVRVEQLGAQAAPRRFEDYEKCVHVNGDNLPAGVTLHRMVGK